MIGQLVNNRGVTITETLAALVLFMTVAAGLAASTVTVIQGNSLSNRMAAAASLAQGKIEEFRSVGSAAESAELTSGNHADPRNPISALGESNGAFMRSWTVTPGSPHAGLAKVEVTVKWTAPKPGSITSVTLICENASCM